MLANKNRGVVGLDIEAGSVAAAEVTVNGRPTVKASGILPLPPGVFREGEITDVNALGDALRELFGRHKLPKAVRLGVANQRVAVRTLRLPFLEDPKEIDAAIRFQAKDHIPMPLDQAVMEHQVVGHPVTDHGERRTDVVVVAARREMVMTAVAALRKAGLRPAGVDLSAFGLVRALASELRLDPGTDSSDALQAEPELGPDGDTGAAVPTTASARLFCNLSDVTTLAVAAGGNCEFTRVSPFGVEGVAQRLAERRGLTLDHAREWLIHVGFERPLEEIEGDIDTVAAARDALVEGATKLVEELRLSLEFHGAQEGAHAVESVIVTGPGSVIPGVATQVERELGYRVDVGRPAALSHLDEPSAARLTLPYGLALEE
jgi:type IV pilus assembly protein PilM